MKKVLIYGGVIAVLLVIIILLVFSCKGSKNEGTGGPVTLKYWRSYQNEAVFKPLFDSFYENNSNIKVEYSQKDLSEYYGELLDALAAGTGPDIFSIRNDWLPAFKDKIELIPEDVYSKDKFKGTFVDAATNDLIIDNGIYGFPLSVDAVSLIYNDNLLDAAKCARPPKNWNEFIDCNKKITHLKGSYVNLAGTALGTVNNLDTTELGSKKLATDILSAMMIQSGTEMVSADLSSASFGLPIQKASGGNVYPGTTALDFYTSFARPTKETYSWNSRMDNAVKAFAEKKVAMIFGYSDMVGVIDASAPNIGLNVAPMPQIKGSDNPKTTASYWIEVVSKQSKYKTEGWKLLDFLTSVKSLSQFRAATNLPSSRKDMIEAAEASTKYGAFTGQLTYAVTWYKGKQPSKVYEAFVNMINGVLHGQKPQNAIDSARNAVTALFLAQKQEGQ